MRLRILSDLHLEFHRDHGATFIQGQADDGYDALILAGDITLVRHLPFVMAEFRKAAGSRPILFVAGNHEFYGSSVEEAERKLGSLGEDPHFHWLDERAVTLDGVRFVGTTLWFPHSGVKQRLDASLNDFSQIAGFRKWVGGKAAKAARFLQETVREGDVVLTHHLPHRQSIHPFYVDSPLNPYFYHDLDDLVESRKARLWVHGHTHCSMNYTVGQTRVVCNPFGYLRHEENGFFDERLTVEVP